jgi:hypothetical protein
MLVYMMGKWWLYKHCIIGTERAWSPLSPVRFTLVGRSINIGHGLRTEPKQYDSKGVREKNSVSTSLQRWEKQRNVEQ